MTPPDFVYEREKKIRLCDECYSKLNQYIKKDEGPLRRGVTFYRRLSSNRILEIEAIINIQLTDKLHQLSNEVLAYFLKENNYYDKWFDLLSKIVIEALELVQPVVTRCDELNIKKLVKIKKIPYKDASLTKLVRGIVIRKNVSNKKMNTSIEGPTILMIKGNIENKGNAHLSSLLAKILRLNPTIIVTEGTVAWEVQDKILQAGKTLITRLRANQFDAINKRIQGNPISNLEKFDGLNRNILGASDRFEIINYQNKEYYNNVENVKLDEIAENIDCSLMYLEGCEPERGVTILLSGDNYQELVRVKRILQETLGIARNMFLEKSIISQEIPLLHTKEKLWKTFNEKDDETSSIGEKTTVNTSRDTREDFEIEKYKTEKVIEIEPATCLLTPITVASAGFMLRFLTERVSIEKIMKKSSLTLTKVQLVPSFGKSLPDIIKLNVNPKATLDEALGHSKAWYKGELCELHKEPKVLKTPFCSEKDFSIGGFLSFYASRVLEKCPTCSRRYFDHVIFFFLKKFYIFMSLDLKAGSKFERWKKNLLISKPYKSPQNTQSAGENEQRGLFSILAAAQSTGQRQTKDPIPSGPQRKQSIDSNPGGIDTIMYLECSCCETRLSDPIRLKKAYLSYSFTRYIESLTSTAEQYLEYLIHEDLYSKGFEENDSHILKQSPKHSSIKPCCIYGPKNRVFVLDDVLVRLRVGFSKPCILNLQEFTNQKVTYRCQEIEAEMIKKQKSDFRNLQKSYLDVVILSLEKSVDNLLKNIGLEFSIKNIYEDKALTSKIQSNQDMQSTLLLQIIPASLELLEMRNELEKNIKKNMKHYTEIYSEKRSLYEKLIKLYDSIEKARNNYIQSTEDKRYEKMRGVGSESVEAEIRLRRSLLSPELTRTDSSNSIKSITAPPADKSKPSIQVKAPSFSNIDIKRLGEREEIEKELAYVKTANKRDQSL